MDIPQEKLSRILHAAVQAPSGDNSQPWRFEIKRNVIRLFNVPEKDTSPFNYKQTSNYIALGAALENLRIQAEAEGFESDIRFFPDTSRGELVAEIELEADKSTGNELAASITERSSNRKRYDPAAIPSETLDGLKEIASSLGGKLVLNTDRASIERIAYAVSAGEKIALENKDIHDFLFDHVTWSPKDDSNRHGFYIKTFEFKPPQEFVFKLFRNWEVLSFFQKLGVTDFIAKDMEGVYRSSGAFGAIILKDRSKESFMKAGMILERIWLTATKIGLGMQATTSVHLLELAIRDNASTLTTLHQGIIKERYQILEKEFAVNSGEVIAFAFRIGFVGAPSARTTRKEPMVEMR